MMILTFPFFLCKTVWFRITKAIVTIIAKKKKKKRGLNKRILSLLCRRTGMACTGVHILCKFQKELFFFCGKRYDGETSDSMERSIYLLLCSKTRIITIPILSLMLKHLKVYNGLIHRTSLCLARIQSIKKNERKWKTIK